MSERKPLYPELWQDLPPLSDKKTVHRKSVKSRPICIENTVWKQLELDFGSPKKKRRVFINYEQIYERLKQGPMTFHEIEVMTGAKHNAVFQIITTLTLRYPVWSPARGIYKLMEVTDYD